MVGSGTDKCQFVKQQQVGVELPFMHILEVQAIDYCLTLFREPVSALEWGSGNSTLYFSSKLANGSSWYAIEHNLEWAEKVAKQLDESCRTDISLTYIPPHGGWCEGSGDGDRFMFGNYIGFPATLHRNFQIIFVDGRARVDCMRAAWPLLDENGIMILHDAQRQAYDSGVPANCFAVRVTNTRELLEGRPLSLLFMSKSAELIGQLMHGLAAFLPEFMLIARDDAPRVMGVKKLQWSDIAGRSAIRLYAGDIPIDETAYNGLVGLSITKNDARHILHDITSLPFPLPDNSVDSFQAEDVFEHIPYKTLVAIIDEIFRILKPGGLFRLSAPDYGCDVLRERSVKDAMGNIVFDPKGGGTPDNPGHLWFPRVENVYRLLEKTKFNSSGTIEFLHYWNMDNVTFVTKSIDHSKGLIRRTPDHDERVAHPYRPISIVVDLIKDKLVEAGPVHDNKWGREQDTVQVRNRKPLVFMQVHTFYPPYLESFYAQNSSYSACSFYEQLNALVRDGFSANHMIAPYMDQHGYETHLVIANNCYAQEQWARENGVILEASNNWIHEITRRQIETMKPDILYLSDPITFDSKFIRSLTWRPRLIMGWRAADIPRETDWCGFDVMLSCLTGLRDAARRLGAKSTEHFFPGFPVWMNSQISAVQPGYDVVFAGSWTPEQHRSRNELLQAVADNSVGAYSCGYFLNSGNTPLPPSVSAVNHGPRFGIEMYKTLRSGRIVLDARARHLYFDQALNQLVDMGRNETANMRIFEVTGCGSFLLTEFFDNLEDFFEIGKEIEIYRDSDELKRKIRYYLDHPDEREAIARRGQERCLRDYSMERRAEEFDRIIKKHLAAKSCLGNHEPRGVATLLKEASDCLLNGDVNRAFALLVQAKAMKEPVKGVDLARARCFLKMDRIMEAMEALREELRYFPDNSDARECLGSLEKQYRVHSASVEDAEFKSILQIIRPYTMLSEQRLYSLFTLAKRVCEENIPGNFVECGVAAGGSSALLAWVIKKYSRHPRKLFAFDSFSGMPQPTAEDSHQGVDAESSGWGTGTCSAPEESVREICAKLGVADVLTAVKGYFEETLPPMANWVGMIALLHMDGDWYESTRCILHNLYGRLSNDALIQVDDYGYWDGCRKAIHEFEASHSLKFDINPIDGTGVWFVKPDRFPVNPVIPSNLIAEFQQDDPVPQGFTTQMSANERFQLYYSIRTLNVDPTKVFRFIEIGSYGGGSLLLICRALNRMGIKFQGISVEPGGTPQFRHVLNLLGNSVIHVPMFSHAAVQKLTLLFSTSQPPGFILVDGDHTYQGVRQDIIDYYPLLAPGCTMLFHDWLPPLNPENRDYILHHHAGTEPGIRQACDELMVKEYECERIELPLLYPADPTQTQPQLPIIPNVFSTMCAYRKPAAC